MFARVEADIFLLRIAATSERNSNFRKKILNKLEIVRPHTC